MDLEKTTSVGKSRSKRSALQKNEKPVNETHGKRLKHSRYISGFDGLRVLALLGVILYHLLPYDMKGGYLGVPIFFAISGYLITDLFVQEWDQNGSIKIWSFYGRRLKRLYPTLVVILFASTAYMTLFAQNLLTHIKSILWTIFCLFIGGRLETDNRILIAIMANHRLPIYGICLLSVNTTLFGQL